MRRDVRESSEVTVAAPLPVVVHRAAHIDDFLTLGTGTTVSRTAAIGPLVTIGAHDHVSGHTVLGHG